ncbi:MAG: hypothetical protein WBG50_21590 [Desulfomonilaceae bacterium]
MRKSCLILGLCVVFLAVCLCAWAAPPIGVKVIPESVDWPLVRPAPYRSPKKDLRQEDIYELTFGVRRWLSGIETPNGVNFQNTLYESYKWLDLYGCYGVLGNGEDVFTRQGARFRRLDRGR